MNLWPRLIPLYFYCVVPGILLGLMGLCTLVLMLTVPVALTEALRRRKEGKR